MGHEIDGRRTLLKQRHDNSRSNSEIVGDETLRVRAVGVVTW